MILNINAIKGSAFDLIVPCYDGEWSSQYLTSPTGLDSEKSQDKGLFSDCTNEWIEIGSSGVGYLTLTTTEMDYDIITVKITSTTVGAQFPLIVISTSILAMDSIIEGTYTTTEVQRLLLSTLVGKINGGGTSTISFRDTGDTKNRIVASVDANGNRTTVTLDES